MASMMLTGIRITALRMLLLNWVGFEPSPGAKKHRPRQST